ncbi:hypothetical protein CDV31_011617 [Fusarium ambrosium]|uniref:Uncharacterized protein n=1 Tax=Fusarium ambrosium TaxID=131363 RepID=A0A428TFM9_9HYPO|nr:hypothetical protein CDV31_011617 [Fusarium ambrosium]
MTTQNEGHSEGSSEGHNGDHSEGSSQGSSQGHNGGSNGGSNEVPNQGANHVYNQGHNGGSNQGPNQGINQIYNQGFHGHNPPNLYEPPTPAHLPTPPNQIRALQELILMNLRVIYPGNDMEVLLCMEAPGVYYACVIHDPLRINKVLFRGPKGPNLEVPLVGILREVMVLATTRYHL